MDDFNEHRNPNIANNLLLGAGAIFMLAFILFNEFIVVLFVPHPPLNDDTIEKIRSAQIFFLSAGLMLTFISELVRRISRLNKFMNKGLVVNIELSFLTVFLLLSLTEMALRPLRIETPKTIIFVRDSELGWKLRANAEDLWGLGKVKINGKGLRGPELDYEKPSNVIRILYLGDSVTFGYPLDRHEQTFPYLTEAILKTRTRKGIETINAGVDGYSPWQEYIYLSKEGIKYKPDLVIVSFILNDVTEKFRLKLFGGETEGGKIERSALGIKRFFRKSSIIYFTKKLSDRMRFGSDIQKGAIKKEGLRVTALFESPDSETIKNAWNITLENLTKIFTFCKKRNMPIILAIFPWTTQFDDPDALSDPQKLLSQFATEHDITVVDLLPMFSQKMRDEGTKPSDYFFDHNHLRPAGNKIVAEFLAEVICKEGVLDF